MKIKILAAGFVLLAAALAEAQTPPPPAPDGEPSEGRNFIYVAPRLSMWVANMNGKIEADEGWTLDTLIDGSTVSFDEELMIDDTEAVPRFEFLLMEQDEFGGLTRTRELMRAVFMYTRYEGDTTLDDPEVFNGRLYPAGTYVESGFRFWMAGVDFSAIDRHDPEGFSGDVFFGARVWDVTLSMKAGGQRNDEELRLLLLGVGLAARWQFGPIFSIEARNGGYVSLWSEDSFFEVEDGAGAYYEGEIAMNATFPHVRTRVGLAMLAGAATLEREDSNSAEDDDWAFFMGGPFIDVSVYF